MPGICGIEEADGGWEGGEAVRKEAPADPSITGAWDLRKVIFPGDKITFNSVAACRNVTELCRAPGATVVATGKAKAVYKDWVLVELRSGVREGANRGNISKVTHVKKKGAKV